MLLCYIAIKHNRRLSMGLSSQENFADYKAVIDQFIKDDLINRAYLFESKTTTELVKNAANSGDRLILFALISREKKITKTNNKLTKLQHQHETIEAPFIRTTYFTHHSELTSISNSISSLRITAQQLKLKHDLIFCSWETCKNVGSARRSK